MKTTTKHFELFKDECRYWQKEFELSHVRLDFFFKDINNDLANCAFYTNDQIAEITLNIKSDKDDNTTVEKIIKRSAKHEMIEVLIGELRSLVSSPYVTRDEMFAANHRLVGRLEKLIK